jgi:hypothetical protein
MEPIVNEYSLQTFLPLITIFLVVFGITAIHQWYYGFTLHDALRIFMAAFFLVFGFFKIINLHEFAEAYSMYDIIAKRAYWYGYVYPFIELALGLAYLFDWRPKFINIFTLCIMMICAAGVFIELRAGHKIVCACLGAVFKVPMTYVTLLEDLMTAAMAALMLFI